MVAVELDRRLRQKKPALRPDAVSTEGRIFAAQLTRDLAAREIAGAKLLSPGTTDWFEAFQGFAQSLRDSGSPTRAAKVFLAAHRRLVTAQKHGSCFVNGFMHRSRSAAFEVLTYEVAKHPLTNTGYEGIVVQSYICQLQRRGRIVIGLGALLAFVSWHALARMYERSSVDIFEANGVVALCGMAGVLMRESGKHANTEINLVAENMICTGVLRFVCGKTDGTYHGFFDVLTVLSADEEREPKKIAQGIAVAKAVDAYVRSDDADPEGYADKIAVLPFHESDFVSRKLSLKRG